MEDFLSARDGVRGVSLIHASDQRAFLLLRFPNILALLSTPQCSGVVARRLCAPSTNLRGLHHESLLQRWAEILRLANAQAPHQDDSSSKKPPKSP